MATIDLGRPGPRSQFSGSRASLRKLPMRTAVGAVLFSVSFGAAQSRAQDVAEAARQARAHKQNQQTPPEHVYTDDDLRRSRILTPQDQARVEAKRNNQPAPAAQPPAEPVDAESLPAKAPLGDVARRYRKQKESREAQRAGKFHLPVGGAALATPVAPARPAGRVPSMKPAPARVDPFRRRATLAPERIDTRREAKIAPAVSSSRPAGAVIAAGKSPLREVVVRRGDTLWALAARNLGAAAKWRELLAVNPRITNPNLIVAGSAVRLPSSAGARGLAVKVTIQTGDTLSQIARARFGHANFWRCIALANPQLRDPNVIYAGRQLMVPSACDDRP